MSSAIDSVESFMSEGIIHSEEENAAGDGKCRLLLTRFESFMSEGIIHSEEENVAGDGKCCLFNLNHIYSSSIVSTRYN